MAERYYATGKRPGGDETLDYMQHAAAEKKKADGLATWFSGLNAWPLAQGTQPGPDGLRTNTGVPDAGQSLHDQQLKQALAQTRADMRKNLAAIGFHTSWQNQGSDPDPAVVQQIIDRTNEQARLMAQARIASSEPQGSGSQRHSTTGLAPEYGKGNIDQNNLPVIPSSSQVFSYALRPEQTGQPFVVLVPAIRDGLDRVMTEEEALQWYQKSGGYYLRQPVAYGNVDLATAMAEKYAGELHQQLAPRYAQYAGISAPVYTTDGEAMRSAQEQQATQQPARTVLDTVDDPGGIASFKAVFGGKPIYGSDENKQAKSDFDPATQALFNLMVLGVKRQQDEYQRMENAGIDTQPLKDAQARAADVHKAFVEGPVYAGELGLINAVTLGLLPAMERHSTDWEKRAGIDNPYRDTINIFSKARTEHPTAYGVGEIAGSLLPGIAMEKAAAALLGKALPKLSGTLIQATVASGAAGGLQNALLSVGNGGDTEQAAQDFLIGMLLGSAGGSGIKMVTDLAGGFVPKAGTRLWDEWLQSGLLLDRLRPATNSLAQTFAELSQMNPEQALDAPETPFTDTTLDPMRVADEAVRGYTGDAGNTFSPINPGPLDESIANTFRSGTYTKKVLAEDTTFYRVYGGGAGEVGLYMSRTPQFGGMQSQLDLALNPKWGNTATNVTKVTVPKGTVIYEGFAAPQTINGGAGLLMGGGNQIYIPEVNASWFGK